MVETLINISNFIAPVFYKILYMSIVGSILGILILGLTKLLDNKLSAKWKFYMLLIPILFLMIPVSKIQVNIEDNFALTSVINRVETTLNNTPTLNYDTSNIEEEKISSAKKAIEKESSINIQETKVNKNENTFYTIIPIIWVIGITISMSIFIIGNINLIYRITKSKKLEDNMIKVILIKCKRKLGISKKIEIRIQNKDVSPCIYGIIKPKILVSNEFIKNDVQVIENVFMHELSHYKRKDIITNYILLIMTTIHWFNPFVYRFFRKMRQEMELATDEIALRKMDKEEKKKYGLTLISLLQTYENQRVVAKTLCVTDDSKNMERRIKKIKELAKSKKYRTSVIILILVFVICAIIPFILKPTKISSLEEEKIYQKIEQYLINLEEKNHQLNNKNDDFRVFIDIEKMGTKKEDEETIAYAWVLIKTYYVQNGKLQSSGSSMPYKFRIKDNEIKEYKTPEDGERYISSINEIFPKNIREKIQTSSKKVSEEKIENKAQEYYKYLNTNNFNETQYYETNASNAGYIDNQNRFVGHWKPYKAEENGKEINLREVYGSGISEYGGELILENDGTFSELIGIYSKETERGLIGKYKVYGNGENALLTNNNEETKIVEFVNENTNIIRMTLEDGKCIYFKRASK